ncbi:NAD(P)/FAD-dependent oxidoreductase [Herbiconiux sp. VKM Ac-2851]|uniref:protoporphyrinogen/coproporphyrinogen oxidase n=1 Tax=Herbiconiux sp. VKM Ac-2851 TaxID=2739025 RepID=UPI0015635A33|nr:FAD-dependent oxidoreductase [Herbiconiux sp. VKM Ac-2851]NQX34783.1 FAD-dependent oxidoreductase [Herbiconiux sp. VKM Ac-2851]
MTDVGGGTPAAAGGPDVDVLVIGGGAAGLVTALQLAKLGHSVHVVEARERPGGFVSEHELAGIRLDSGAESFATRKGTVAALAAEVGLGDDVVAPNRAGAWVRWNGGTAPLPAAGILGIPGVPLADDVRRVIGWGGSLRAYLDRLMPLLRVRPEHDLGDIVRRRMGRRVLDRLVTPVVAGVHSADPSDVDVRTVAPGLTQAMTTQGSLSGAVMALREQAPAGSQVQGIVGGMHRLISALEEQLAFYGGTLETGTRVVSLQRSGEAGLDDRPDARPLWSVELARATAPSTPSATPPPTSAAPASPVPRRVTARALVVAAGFRPALTLLADAGVAALPAATAWPEPASVAIATLVVDDARLDAHPRGTGVLVAPGTTGVTAKALTHATAKWAWLAAQLPPHRHVLRLSYGRGGETLVEPELATVVADASTLLGVPLSVADVVDSDLVRWDDSLAFATVGHKARVAQLSEAVAAVPGLDVVGAWVSGTGLAATVEQAKTTASGIAAELRGHARLPR